MNKKKVASVVVIATLFLTPSVMALEGNPQVKLIEKKVNTSLFEKTRTESHNEARELFASSFEIVLKEMTTSNLGGLAKVGDVINLVIETSLPLDLIEGDIGGVSLSFSQVGNRYEASLPITEGMLTDNAVIPLRITCTQGSDTIQLSESDFDPITFYDAIEITDLSFKSNNTKSDALAKNGDNLILSFTSNHPVNGNATINGQPATVNSLDNIHYQAILPVTNSTEFNDGSRIPFSLSITDAAGNPQVIKTNGDADPVTYIAPFTIQNVTFTTNNPSGRFVKNDDQVCLSFDTSKDVTLVTTLAGQPVVNTGSFNHYQYEKSIQYGDCADNQVIPFNVVAEDQAGNKVIISQEELTQKLTYYAPIALETVNFQSNNLMDRLYAKDGDDIHLDFSTTHPVQVNQLKIGGAPQTAETSDQLNFTKKLLVTNGMVPDQGTIQTSFNLTDAAGNTTYVFKEADTQGILYFAPIQASNLMLVSTNGSDGTKYLKNGDIAKVSFEGNHPLIVTGEMNGSKNSILENNNLYTMEKTIESMTDLSTLTFSFTLNDKAGNTPVTLTHQDVGNVLTYYAPIQATTVMISSNVKNKSFAKEGDVITTSMSSNHETILASATIQGRGANVEGNHTKNPVATSPMGNHPEGVITFSHTLKDVAGNEATVDQATEKITYDRTSPNVKITPDLRGFTNNNVNVKSSYEDLYLDTNSVSFFLNNEEKIKQATVTGNIYEQSITITDEDEYIFIASASDQAGNVAKNVNGKIIIDKTDPLITAININFDEIPAYKSGFILRNHIDVYDKYIKEIQCNVREKKIGGLSKAWGIDEPIFKDGLKTITVKATDMALNQSKVLNFDMYIDAKPPKIKLVNTKNNIEIKSQSNSSIDKGSKLKVQLESMWVGNEKPDRFTKMDLKDEKSGEVKNILESSANKEEKIVEMNEEGNYLLLVSAIDDVGNVIEEESYNLIVKDIETKKIIAEQMGNKNTKFFIILISVLLIITSGYFGYLANKKRKNKNSKEVE
ncbi:MAG: hypothetical protein ACRCU3_08355 [Eubacteriaceae bacterium]